LGVKLKFPTFKKFDRRSVDERTVHGYVKVSVACWCFQVQCISSVGVLSQVFACISCSSSRGVYAAGKRVRTCATPLTLNHTLHVCILLGKCVL
jgi:hypothetical protein